MLQHIISTSSAFGFALSRTTTWYPTKATSDDGISIRHMGVSHGVLHDDPLALLYFLFFTGVSKIARAKAGHSCRTWHFRRRHLLTFRLGPIWTIHWPAFILSSAPALVSSLRMLPRFSCMRLTPSMAYSGMLRPGCLRASGTIPFSYLTCIFGVWGLASKDTNRFLSNSFLRLRPKRRDWGSFRNRNPAFRRPMNSTLVPQS